MLVSEKRLLPCLPRPDSWRQILLLWLNVTAPGLRWVLGRQHHRSEIDLLRRGRPGQGRISNAFDGGPLIDSGLFWLEPVYT